MKGSRLLRSWRFRVVAAVAVAAFVSLVLWVRSGQPDAILAEGRGPDGELTRDQVERLLSSAVRDKANEEKRERYKVAWSLWPIGYAVSGLHGTAFPDRNTRLKIAHAGLPAAKQLLNVALDAQEAPAMREMAVDMLGAVDPHGTLEAFKQPILSGQAGALLAGHVLRYCLPGPDYWGADWSFVGAGMQEFTPELSSKVADAVYLRALDAAVECAPQPNDLGVLYWLNRYNGVDFGEWLEKNAPEVHAFRTREIERGCDPVRLIESMQWWHGHMVGESLVRQLYSSKSDQAAMQRLLEICRESDDVCEDMGWKDKLTQWYSANRSRLVYDPQVMHFVVGAKPETVSEKVGK